MNGVASLTRLGRYRILRELGRGAMGIVYEAEDESLGRPVAVKTLSMSDDLEERAELEARFRQEAKAAGGLNHPSVVTIYEMGREGDLLFIAMELLRGTELREMMRAGVLAPVIAVDLIAQVAAGLAAAHRHGIVHRDIKPSNIMVLPGNRAKLMDFGVARMSTSEVHTRAGVMLGSPQYMSPEQVQGRPVDPRSDIFSLGAVLYEAVTGAPAFEGRDLGTLLHNIVQDNRRPVRERHPDVPEPLERAIEKAMARDPQERYRDAAQFAEDLARCVTLLGGVPGGSLVVPEALPPVPAAPAAADPAFEKTQAAPALDRTQVASAADRTQAVSAFGRTQAVPLPRAAKAGQTEPANDQAQPAAAAALRVSRRFDSAVALARLAQGGGAGPAVRRAGGAWRGRWAWPAAYAAAVLVAFWIATG